MAASSHSAAESAALAIGKSSCARQSLILDEPTNDLDLSTLQILGKARGIRRLRARRQP